MTVAHRPPQELLLDYAAGTLAEPLALLVASHLVLCPESRRHVAELEALGGALLESAAPATLAEDSLTRTLARLEASDGRPAPDEATEPPHPSPGDETVPGPLRAYLGGAFGQIAWRRLGPKMAEVPLLTHYYGVKTRLLRIKAGAGAPAHGHEGHEYTLVLQGAYEDELGHYRRGDVSVCDSSVTHHPVADPGADCICLVVHDGPLKFKGLVGRALNRFIRI